MKDLIALYLECKKELADIDIHVGEIRSVKSKPMKSRWGACKCRRDFIFTYFFIEINERLLDDSVPVNSTKSTIMHELLHTVSGCQNHGVEFKRLADKVNSAYGYNVAVRTSEVDKKSVVCDDAPKYLFRCKKCGQIIKCYKKSRFTENYEKYRCGRCNGNFERMEDVHCEEKTNSEKTSNL